MPQVRMMNWNIEQLSYTKITIPGMATAIARTVTAANVDILIVLEVKMTNVAAAMGTLSAALNAEEGGNNWNGYFLSRKTGKEYYCVLIRDLDFIRPVFNQAGVGPNGTYVQPLVNLKKNVFEVWPSANWPPAGNSAYPLPANPPRIPLLDLYAKRPHGRRKANFGGQSIGDSGRGYSLGHGFRLPAMALFQIHTAAGDYLIPVIMCHFAAVRSGRNFLGQGQVRQLKWLHIPQMFNDNPPGGTSYYLDVINAAGAHNAVRVQEICFTGDFNMDFLQNSNAGDATNEQKTNHISYLALTPTLQQGGSASPPAAPGAAEVPVPALLPYGPPWAFIPLTTNIEQQQLRASVTMRGTMLRHYRPTATPPPYVSAAFDNFIYGGTQLNTAVIHGHGDSGEVIDIQDNIVKAGGAGAQGQIDLSAVAAHYAGRPRKKNADNAPTLQQALGVGPPLSNNDRLIGARLVSDHLPVVLEFTCP